MSASAACAGAGTVSSTGELARPATTPATVREADVRRLLTALAADSMEGRGTATPGSARAAALIADELRRYGVQPAGDSGYFQRVPLARQRRGTTERLVLLDSATALDTVARGARATAVNVVAIIPGADSRLREEFVLIGAHYDHVGIGRPVNGDSIYNGADDDASGVVAVLEIARALTAGPRPRRTVIFLASTGEELGLLGTEWFKRHPARPLSQMVANLQIEMIGRPDSLAGGAGRGWLTGYERSTMGDAFAAASLPIVADPRPTYQFFLRSDNIAFARAGIVAHTLSSYNLHTDYHQPTDDVSRVDFTHMTALVEVAVRAARVLTDSPRQLEWKPGGRP